MVRIDKKSLISQLCFPVSKMWCDQNMLITRHCLLFTMKETQCIMEKACESLNRLPKSQQCVFSIAQSRIP